METTLHFTEEEKEKATMCINIDRLTRILDNVWDYADEKEDQELLNIINDYLGLKEL